MFHLWLRRSAQVHAYSAIESKREKICAPRHNCPRYTPRNHWIKPTRRMALRAMHLHVDSTITGYSTPNPAVEKLYPQTLFLVRLHTHYKGSSFREAMSRWYPPSLESEAEKDEENHKREFSPASLRRLTETAVLCYFWRRNRPEDCWATIELRWQQCAHPLPKIT